MLDVRGAGAAAGAGFGRRFRGWIQPPSISTDDRRARACPAVGSVAPNSPTIRCESISPNVRSGQKLVKGCRWGPSPIGEDGHLVRACRAVGAVARGSQPRKCGGTSSNAENVPRFPWEGYSCKAREAENCCQQPRKPESHPRWPVPKTSVLGTIAGHSASLHRHEVGLYPPKAP